MDISTQLVRQLEQFPHARVAPWVTGLLVVVLLYVLAQITWKLVPAEQAAFNWQPPPASSDPQPARSLDLTALQDLHLFGKPAPKTAAPAPKPVQSAPKTKLKLVLTGAVASDDPQKSAAIIESSNKQETYGVGDKITGTSATVREIHSDRVILNNRGVAETLMLDGVELTRSSTPATRTSQPRQRKRPGVSAKRVDKRSDLEVSERLAQYRQELAENPGQLAAKLTDFIKISPVKEDGELRGFRVNPGKQPELFSEMGLRSNDLAIAINGMDLTDMSTAMQVVNELSELSEVALTVEREGQLHEILFSVPE